MKQYIDKDIIKAEIERKKIPFKRDIADGNYPTYLCALMDFEDFLDTLEVKEVTNKKTDWSPSKKQIESLKDMLKWNIGDFNYQKWMEVNSLYDDLTKIDTPVSDSRKANHTNFIKELKQKIDSYERELSKSGDSVKCDDVDWVILASDMFDMLQKCLKNYTG